MAPEHRPDILDLVGDADDFAIRATLNVLVLLERLKKAGVPVHMTAFQRSGRCKAQHTTFHGTANPRTKRHAGLHSGYLMAPELCGVFHNPKASKNLR